MTTEQANKLESGDIVYDKTCGRKIEVCFRRSEEFFECSLISPDYGWCNRKYVDLELTT